MALCDGLQEIDRKKKLSEYIIVIYIVILRALYTTWWSGYRTAKYKNGLYELMCEIAFLLSSLFQYENGQKSEHKWDIFTLIVEWKGHLPTGKLSRRRNIRSVAYHTLSQRWVWVFPTAVYWFLWMHTYVRSLWRQILSDSQVCQVWLSSSPTIFLIVLQPLVSAVSMETTSLSG